MLIALFFPTKPQRHPLVTALRKYNHESLAPYALSPILYSPASIALSFHYLFQVDHRAFLRPPPDPLSTRRCDPHGATVGDDARRPGKSFLSLQRSAPRAGVPFPRRARSKGHRRPTFQTHG